MNTSPNFFKNTRFIVVIFCIICIFSVVFYFGVKTQAEASQVFLNNLVKMKNNNTLDAYLNKITQSQLKNLLNEQNLWELAKISSTLTPTQLQNVVDKVGGAANLGSAVGDHSRYQTSLNPYDQNVAEANGTADQRVQALLGNAAGNIATSTSPTTGTGSGSNSGSAGANSSSGGGSAGGLGGVSSIAVQGAESAVSSVVKNALAKVGKSSSGVSVSGGASIPLLKPFGGMILVMLKCYFPPGATYVVLGPPRGGKFLWLPQTLTFAYGPPKMIGQWLLGQAFPINIPCFYALKAPVWGDPMVMVGSSPI